MANLTGGPESLVGTKLGSCRLEKILGSGGMGTVYLAHHGPTDSDVAVKVLAPQLATDAEYVARFIREGKEAGRIEHPNVVKVIEADKDNGTYFIVMEYIRGKALDEILRDEKRLSFSKATRIIRDVAKGLEAAQSKGVIHRDIKPANILMDPRGNPKISDFGLAKQAGTRKGLTVEGLFMGTPEYVSPEQAEGKKVDFRTDMYSLGVTYYQLLSGKYPFTGQTDVEMAMKRLKEDPRPLQDAFPGVEARAIPIVHRMLKRAPEERYQTAKELLSALSPLVTNEKKAMPAVPKTATVIGRLPRDVQKRVRAVFASALLLPALALFFAAGATAPGGGTFAKSLAAVGGSGASIGLLGLGALALGGGLFVLRRELKNSGRAVVVTGMLALAMLMGTAAMAGLERAALDGPWACFLETVRALTTTAVVAPVNLMMVALALALVMCAMCFEMDDDSPRPIAQLVGLCLSVVLWYAFAAGDPLLGPFRMIAGSLETALPLLVVAVLSTFCGIACVSARSVEMRTRKIGAGLMGAGAVALLLFGAAGAGGVIDAPGKWPGALWDRVKDVPGSFGRSGALAVVALLLTLGSVFVLRAGIARAQAFYSPKK